MTKLHLDWLHANYNAAQDGPCVLWPFKTNRGYGRVQINGKRMTAHHYALTLRGGPAPDGADAAHGPCHNPLCIIHVSWKTHAENMADMHRDHSVARGQRHGSAKLNEDAVREIRRLGDLGVSTRNIAQRFMVSTRLVNMIKARSSWAWLD